MTAEELEQKTPLVERLNLQTSGRSIENVRKAALKFCAYLVGQPEGTEGKVGDMTVTLITTHLSAHTCP